MTEITFQQKFVDFANVLKSFIGSVFLTMPFAFYQSGIVLGVIMLLLVGWLSDHCCVKIVKCKDMIIKKLIEDLEKKQIVGLLPLPEAELLRSGLLKSKLEARITLGHIAKYTFGKKGQWLVIICLFVSQFGFCTSYIVVIGNTLFELVSFSMTTKNSSLNVSSQTSMSGDSNMLIYMCLVPIPIFILFSLLRTIRNMGWISIAANFAIGLGYISILGVLINQFTASDYQLCNFESVAIMFGLLTSAFEGIGTVIPIETSMIGNRENFPFYMHVTICLVIFVLGSFGIIGHLRYGSHTEQIILLNLDQSVFIFIVNTILMISVVCTYPLQMFPVVEIVEYIFFRKRSAKSKEDRVQLLKSHRVNNNQLDVKNGHNKILVEFCASDVHQRISESPVSEISLKFHHYESAPSSISTSSNKAENGSTRSDPDSIYTKQQMHMIRVLYDSDITAPAWKRNCIRVFLVLLQLSLAIVMKSDFAYLGALIGAIGSSFLSYIFPSATENKLIGSTEKRLYYKLFNWSIVLFGILGSILSLVVTVKQIVKRFS